MATKLTGAQQKEIQNLRADGLSLKEAENRVLNVGTKPVPVPAASNNASAGSPESRKSAAYIIAQDPMKSTAERLAAVDTLKHTVHPGENVRVAEIERSINLPNEIEAGTERGKKLVGDLGRADTKLGRVNEKLGRVDTSLGRVKEDQYSTEKSSDVQDILARRRDALSGVDSSAAMADRAKASEAFGVSEETTRRRLSGIQANTGVRGDTAATQQAGALYQGLQARSNYERDLVIANTQLRSQALNSYEQSVQSAEAAQNQARSSNIALSQYNLGQQLQERNLQNINLGQEQQERNLQNINLGQQLKERELEKFNLQQAARERFGAIGVGFGMAQLNSAATSADKQALATQAAAAAQGSGGK